MMFRSTDDERPGRRAFLKLLGLAGVSSAFTPPTLAFAQSASGSSGATPPPASATPAGGAASGGPGKPSAEAEALAAVVRQRHGEHLSDEELAMVAKDIQKRLDYGKKLREPKLRNEDEPDFTFKA